MFTFRTIYNKLEISTFLKFLKKQFILTFSNVDTALKMYLTIMPFNATGERPFNVLKIIKNYQIN